MRTRPPWYYRQSAVVPCRRGEGGVEVLLITSRSGKRWGIPKGIVELTLTPAESARKEAFEEAGVLGRVSMALGEYQYEKWGGTCVVAVYVLEVDTVLDRWPEDWRRRQWLTVEAAVEAIEKRMLREIVAKVSTALPR